MIVVADTSALYAAFDQKHEYHDAAYRIVAAQTLVLSPLVVTELDHLVHRDAGFPAALEVMDSLNAGMSDGQYRLAPLAAVDMAAAHEVRVDYRGLRLDLADAVGVVLADRYKTDRIFTLDQRDFRAIKPLTKSFDAFRLPPIDPLN